MKPKFKKRTAIAVGFVGSMLWGATCILENQNAIAQLAGEMFIVIISPVAIADYGILNSCEI